MPANRKAEDIEIARALLEWRGNITAAAEALGMSRQALNDRILRAGLLPQVDAFRGMSAGSSKVVTSMKPSAAASTFTGGHTSGARRIQGCVNSTDSRPRPNVAGMSAASPAVPFPTQPRRPQVRIRPGHLDSLVGARIDLMSVLRSEVSEQDILNRCLDKYLARSIAEDLAAARGEAPEEEARRG